MRISLIGMSGSGKSHWSAMLAVSGFTRYCCDDLITEKLASELRSADGKALALGQWMGFPFEQGYLDREARYLRYEKEVLSRVFDRISTPEVAGGEEPSAGSKGEGRRENVVVDTTGSVIYTGKALLKRLKALTRVVHFTSPPEARDEMLRQYLAKPRPVLWHGLYSVNHGETPEEALARCYRILLDSREKSYRAIADVEIDYQTRRRPGFGVEELLEIALAEQ